MKALYVLIVFIFSLINEIQDTNFINEMKKNIIELNNADTIDQYKQCAEEFLQISKKYNTEWLPYYYCAYSFVAISYYTQGEKERDRILDEAQEFIVQSESLCKQKDDAINAEFLLLRAFVIQARYSINPDERAPKLFVVAGQLIELAKRLDKNNPRYFYLKGESIFYSPKRFGGGKITAKPLLVKAKEKFAVFVPQSAIYPNWGEKRVDFLLSECNKK